MHSPLTQPCTQPLVPIIDRGAAILYRQQLACVKLIHNSSRLSIGGAKDKRNCELPLRACFWAVCDVSWIGSLEADLLLLRRILQV